MTILACSKGAEVYSVSYAIRCARPDLNIRLHALDIENDILEFAERGIYSLRMTDGSGDLGRGSIDRFGNVAVNTSRGQNTSVFERMSPKEIEAMFDCEGDLVKVKSRFREGIDWQAGDARDPNLVHSFGLQDIVFANRFLCHMPSQEAETCLLNLARLVKPGGYLFISGVDLDVRAKVAGALGWEPVKELLPEVHEGDPSLRRGWPLEYWGLEPFDPHRADCKVRYAAVFQCAGTVGERTQPELAGNRAADKTKPPSSEIANSLDLSL